MTVRKRALGVLAAGALFAPLVSMGSVAYAVGEDTPPAPRSVANFCQNVEDTDPFTDVSDENRFDDNIECLFAAEITRGLSGGNQYGPELSVRRDQMASFIARMIDKANELEIEGVRELPAFDGTNEFTDVTANNTHREAINRLADADIVRGGPGGTPRTFYGADLEVQRAQMASFIIRALEFMTGEEYSVDGARPDFFTDDENATPHEPNINGIAALAIAVGDGNNSFNPFQDVSRQQMSAFLTRALAFLEEEGFIRPLFEDAEPQDPTVTVETQNVVAGEDILITIESDNIDSVEVLETSDDCVNAGTFGDDADTAEDGFQVVIPTNADATVGECTVRILITDNDGNEFEAEFTVTIEAAQEENPTALTEAPDLIDAEFVRNTTTSTGTTTTVRFTFDEDVISTVNAGAFNLYSFDGTQFPGQNAARESGNSDSVLVVFNVDAEQFAEVTLATVDRGAVEDVDGNENPIGDEPLGSGVTFTAGRTDAPDVISVGNFRNNETASPSATLVDFTFDENAFVVNEAGFELITPSGQEIQCIAVDNTATGETGDFQGDGTTTITVSCENEDLDGDNVADPITAADVARGVVLEGTVTSDDAATTGVVEGTTNPLQVTDANDGGATTLPDLVSVVINDDNTVTFTFDENVTVENIGGFQVYDRDGTEFQGTAAATDTDDDDNVVIVQFAGENLDTVTGASVDEGAVRETGTGGNRLNEEDEVGVSSATVASGFTVGPDLTDVTRTVETTTSTDPITGETTTTETGVTFRFIFDDEATVTDDTRFFVVTAEGDRIVLAGCAQSTTEGEENVVECEVASGDANFESARNAVVGTVDDGAVTDDEGDTNPEGAEAIEETSAA
jgi:hypothetical protein